MVSLSVKKVVSQGELILEKDQVNKSLPAFDRFWKLAALPMVFFLVIPLAALVFRVSPAVFLKNLSGIQVLQAIAISFQTALITTILVIMLGTPLAYLLSKKNFRFYRLLDSLVDLPTVLPPAVAGVALLMAFGRNGLLGGWLSTSGHTIPFTRLAVILAQTFVAAPLYIKAAAIGFSNIDPEMKQAAALDGADRWQVFRQVILPLSWTSLLSGAALTWARALGEFGATIIFAGNLPGRTQTMPLAIYLGFENDLQIALTLSVILISLSFLSLILVKVFLYRKLDVEKA